MGHSRPFLFIFVFSIQLVVNEYTNVQYKFYQWLDSNYGPLVSEATTLPTEPPPLPTYGLLWFFLHGLCFKAHLHWHLCLAITSDSCMYYMTATWSEISKNIKFIFLNSWKLIFLRSRKFIFLRSRKFIFLKARKFVFLKTED